MHIKTHKELKNEKQTRNNFGSANDYHIVDNFNRMRALHTLMGVVRGWFDFLIFRPNIIIE